jgi:hypothetical protein
VGGLRLGEGQDEEHMKFGRSLVDVFIDQCMLLHTTLWGLQAGFCDILTVPKRKSPRISRCG